MKPHLITLAVLVLLRAATVCAGSPTLPGDTLDRLAADGFSAFQDRTPYALASRAVPGLTLDQAYAIQDGFVRQATAAREKVMGYKAGLTTAKAQEKFGVSQPVCGTLFQSMLRWPGTLFQGDFGCLFIETEIGFRFARKIQTRVRDIPALKQALAIVFPVVELPDLLYADMKGLTAQDIIATNVAARKVLIGKALPVNRRDLNAVSVTLSRNGRVMDTGLGSHAMGDQWEALKWTVNHVIDRGGTIREGDIIITGTLTRMARVTPGSYTADFGSLGKIEFQYRQRKGKP